MQKVDFSSDILKNPDGKILEFVNCWILKGDKLRFDNLWVRNGIIIDSMDVFYKERKMADIQIDCNGLILSPGFIDVQLNGGYGIDFSTYSCDESYLKGINLVARKLLEDGVTSFAPTIITSSPSVYKKVLPLLNKTNASNSGGSGILGAHLEGPFISPDKRGCHPEKCVITSLGANPVKVIEDIYGGTDNIALVTIAPELSGSEEAIGYLKSRGVTVSVGHSTANLEHGERALEAGATMITHLFNAMQSYHHRDPGLIGLLTSDKMENNRQLYYGIISDGIHTHDSALRIAYRTNPDGMVLVTDAIAALGMEDGVHRLGEQIINVKGLHALLDGTNTTAGSVASMPFCIRHLMMATGCSIEFALRCATEKPATLLGISNQKGTLDVGRIADFVLIDSLIQVKATFCSGKRMFVCKS